MLYIDADKMSREKGRQELHKNATSCTEQILEATPPPTKQQLSSHLVPNIKPSIENEQELPDTTGEARRNSSVVFCNGPLHMYRPELADQ